MIDGKRYWTLEAKAFRRLDDTGFTLAELSALYFSRTLVEVLAATPFQQDVAVGVRQAVGRARRRSMRQFLDRLPLVIQAKGASPRPDAGDAARAEPRARSRKLLDATLNHRRATMNAYSMSSRREKEYVIEPYRPDLLAGRHVLQAFVPEYGEVRTFCGRSHPRPVAARGALHAGREPDAAFAHSLGVNEGPPEHIEIAFEPRIAPYVRERQWHASQTLRGPQGRRRRALARRLQRLGAAKLDPGVRPARPRRCSPRRSRRRSRTKSIARARATRSSSATRTLTAGRDTKIQRSWLRVLRDFVTFVTPAVGACS